MAYRRRHGITKASTFKEEIYHRPGDDDDDIPTANKSKLTSSYSFTPTTSSASSLETQAIRASAARRDSPLSSSVYNPESLPQKSKVFGAYEETSGRKDARGFWGVLARKAKSILDDDNMSRQAEATTRSPRFQMADTSADDQNSRPDGLTKMDNQTFKKGLDRVMSSLNQTEDPFESAAEEDRAIVENRPANMKQQIRLKESNPEEQNRELRANNLLQQSVQPQNQMNHENQLKASRDVAIATAAKAKLLLRELKTIKADLTFAKQRCSQLEDENKLLRESRDKGGTAADDDLIRRQLETLLAEKARLARENTVYARENRFLREIVEYHQLTMQDIVCLDEGSDEVTEVDPSTTRMLSVSPPSPSEMDAAASPPFRKEVIPVQKSQKEAPLDDVRPCSTIPALENEKERCIPVNNEEEKATSISVDKQQETKPSPVLQQANAKAPPTSA